MKLIMYGVSRDTVSSEDIHKYSLSESMRACHLTDIRAFEGVVEVVLISTNHRNEYYLYIDEQCFKHGDLLRYLSCHTGKCLEDIILETYSKFNHDVVSHLYGLTSTFNGISESLKDLEQALVESCSQGTAGTVLTDLFNRAVRFSVSLYDRETLYPLMHGDVPKTVQTLRQYYPDKKDINYLVIGNNDCIIDLVKYIVGEPGSYLTFIDRNDKSKALIETVKEWVMLANYSEWRKQIKSVDLSQLVYRLAKADVIIIGPSVRNAWLSNELLEDMHEMRPTAKKQLIIDLSGTQDETLFANDAALNYAQIDDTVETNYSAEKIEDAKTHFEDYLSDQTNEYMAFFNQFNEENEGRIHSYNETSLKAAY